MTFVRQGSVRTDKGSRYLQQLCKHWSHKFPVEFDTERGTVELPAGRVVLTASPDVLRVTLIPTGPDQADRLQRVVVEHLDRFGFRDAPLPFDWDGEAEQ